MWKLFHLLHFVSRGLAINYFLLTFLASIGILQLVAARRGLVGLSLLGSRNPTWGYVLGSILIPGAFVFFFAASSSAAFAPGPASTELTVLFGGGAICALAFTLIIASAAYRIQHRGPNPALELASEGQVYLEPISTRLLKGMLCLPEGSLASPRAAICVLPPPTGPASLGPMVSHLIEEGFITLVVAWDGFACYPEALALLPTAITYLERREEVDSQRIGVLGADLGGDLAIRAASADERIQTVVALAPFIQRANAEHGLGILKELSYLEALRWSRFKERRELVDKLAPLNCMDKMSPRPLLLVYGEDDGFVSPREVQAALGGEAADNLRLLEGEGHFSLCRSAAAAALVARWFKENL